MKNCVKLFVILFCLSFAMIGCGGGGSGGGSGGSILTLPELEDVEGNKYGTCMIGNQLWMAENLRTISFRDGYWMLTGPFDSVEWASAGAATCVYPYDAIGLDSAAAVIEAYGRLYNWYSVNDSRGLCPEGWRVPTEEDWLELIDYLGGEEVAGGKLKSYRTAPISNHPRWESPNTGVTGDYRFNALPGGYRTGLTGFFDEVGYYASFWSSTEFETTFAGTMSLDYSSTFADYGYSHKRAGYSVRCICGDGGGVVAP
ncbi:MAG: fibrobacter succinogenes major paralogous domain-containing protein [Spirochaetota bacterium]